MKGQRNSFGVISMAVVFLGATHVHGATLEEIEKKIEAKYDKIKSYAGKSEMFSETDMGQGNTSKTEGTMQFEWMRSADGKQYYCVEGETVTEMKMGENTIKRKSKTLSIGDGKHFYTLSDNDGQKMAMKMKWEPKMANDVESTFEHLKKGYNCKVLSDEKVGKYDCYVVEAKPKKKEGNKEDGKTLYYFHKDSGIVIQVSEFDGKGKKTMQMTMTEVRPNPDLKKERFEFKLPEGVQMMDMTKMNQSGGAAGSSDGGQSASPQNTDGGQSDAGSSTETAEASEGTAKAEEQQAEPEPKKEEKKEKKRGLGGLLDGLN